MKHTSDQYGFEILAREIRHERLINKTFCEMTVQSALKLFLLGSYWKDCKLSENVAHQGDLALFENSESTNPHFIVEIKRGPKLKQGDFSQGRRYASLNRCSCLVTDGVEYYLTLARDNLVNCSTSDGSVAVITGQQFSIHLGLFEEGIQNNWLNRFLSYLFLFSKTSNDLSVFMDSFVEGLSASNPMNNDGFKGHSTLLEFFRDTIKSQSSQGR